MDWTHLASWADRPDVQQQIREAIRSGAIRVLPDGDGIRIIPTKPEEAGAMRGAHAA